MRRSFDNYFNALFHGIPVSGYTKMVENMLGHTSIEIQLGVEAGDEPYYYLVYDEKGSSLHPEYERLAERRSVL